MNKQIYLKSLGCDKNTVDAEKLLGELVENGLQVTDNISKADLVIINTCCFIEPAKIESIEAIFNALAEKSKKAKIIVTGCLSQRYKSELEKEIPEIDGFFKLNEQDKILEFLNLKQSEKSKRFLITDKPFAYLKISEGCNRNCSYCAIPSIRGNHISYPFKRLFKELQELEKQGIQELILVAQDLTQYGSDLKDNNINLSYLLNKIEQNFNFKWIRLLYLYPEGITDELLETIAQSEMIVPYFDIPIQHTNDRILKLMNRNISKKRIYEIVKKIRKSIPNAILRSTVISGFPSETDEEFNELIHDLEKLQFDRLGSFSYSREEGTTAFKMKDQIDRTVKEERANIINLIQNQIMNKKNSNLINTIQDCLVEEQIDKNTYAGRIYADAPEIDCITYINSKKQLIPGELVTVKIRDSLDYEFIGDLYESTK